MAILEFTRRYAMAHRFLSDQSPKCMTPHGHNETVTVRLTASSPFRFDGANMEAPFEAVKGRWKTWIDGHVDHAFQLNGADPSGKFAGRLDTTRIGVFSHSFGGAVAAQFCHDDARCRHLLARRRRLSQQSERRQPRTAPKATI